MMIITLQKIDRVIGLLITCIAIAGYGIYGKGSGSKRNERIPPYDDELNENSVKINLNRQRCKSEEDEGIDNASFLFDSDDESYLNRPIEIVVHSGACHCNSVRFEVEAPTYLSAVEDTSKLRYPFITVPAERFRLTSDETFCSIYMLKYPRSIEVEENRDSDLREDSHGNDHFIGQSESIATCLFCRKCGVHVCHAPRFPSSSLAHVNLRCIDSATVTNVTVKLVNNTPLSLGTSFDSFPNPDSFLEKAIFDGVIMNRLKNSKKEVGCFNPVIHADTRVSLRKTEENRLLKDENVTGFGLPAEPSLEDVKSLRSTRHESYSVNREVLTNQVVEVHRRGSWAGVLKVIATDPSCSRTNSKSSSRTHVRKTSISSIDTLVDVSVSNGGKKSNIFDESSTSTAATGMCSLDWHKNSSTGSLTPLSNNG